MKKLAILLLCTLVMSCNRATPPRAKHVILIGLDAMGAYGVQRAKTPTLNYLIENGAVSMNTRCVRPTSSSQNWMSMVSGALPIHHGVTDNDWERNKMTIEPCLKNRLGLFPTIFDDIRQQRPDATIDMFYEWSGQARMYDVSVVNRAVTGLDTEQTLRSAIDAFFTDKPDFLFVSLNEPDHVGHAYGHESKEYLNTITRLDAILGELVARLEKEGMIENTVLIVTADHGGLGQSHGGDSVFERTTPLIFFGQGVTRGKVIEPTLLICDVAATIGGLLGVELPRECVGKFVNEAFSPKTDNKIYVPVPYISPSNGFFSEPIEVTITGDVADSEIYYTLNGSTPTTQSMHYTQPFKLYAPAVIQAVVCRKGELGLVAVGDLRVLPTNTQPRVAYKYWEGITSVSLPNFATLGTPARTGYVHEISLDKLDVQNKDHFAVEFNTRLRIDKAGCYTFGVLSDDGSKLYIDGKLIIDNDGSHTADKKYGITELTADLHDVRVEYFDDYMGQRLELYYASDSLSLQVLPFTKFE
ncbi:MAG: alkaline phosphatase family protein [Alistipes sp.]